MLQTTPTTTACSVQSVFFFFNDTATTEIYTLSLHDALPISAALLALLTCLLPNPQAAQGIAVFPGRSEEHTSELQSLTNLVCRLLLEKKKNTMGVLFGEPYCCHVLLFSICVSATTFVAVRNC